MIKINNIYALERDRFQWILKKKTHSEGDIKVNLRGDIIGAYDKDVWVSESFHRTIPQVADKVVNNLNTEEIETISELVEYYKELTEVVNTLIDTKIKDDK